MEDKLKIIQGKNINDLKVFLDGKEIQGIVYMEFRTGLDDVPELTLTLRILDKNIID